MTTHQSYRAVRWAFVFTLLALCVSGFVAVRVSAFGSAAGAGWALTSRSYPTNLVPGETGAILIRVMNIGEADSSGTVTVTDTLPSGVIVTNAGSFAGIGEIGSASSSAWDCVGNGPGGAPRLDGASVVTCTNDPNNLPSLAGGGGGPFRFESGLGHIEGYPYVDPELGIAVEISRAAKDPEVVVNHVTIAGGGALVPASTEEQITIDSKPAGFGIAGADAWFSNADGTIDTQAGSHPYEATFDFDLNNVRAGEFVGEESPHEVRNLEFNLPPGVIGDPHAVPMCARGQLITGECPLGAQIGTIVVGLFGSSSLVRFPVYNMFAPAGKPAEFAFSLIGINTYLDTGVRSGSDYGLTTHVNNIAQRAILSSVLTLWGNPGDPSHDPWRTIGQYGCDPQEVTAFSCKNTPSDTEPFLTLPTSCTGPQTYSLSVNAWEDPNISAQSSFLSHDSNGNPIGFTGCEILSFGPKIAATPDTNNADTPAGLTVDVKPSLGGFMEMDGIGSSDIQNTTVTLPEGVAINPGQAAGLSACQESEANIHLEGVAPACPLSSKVGSDEVELPVLKNSLSGDIYVLQSEPPDLQLLITGSGEGVELKLVAHVHLDERTGRLTTTLTGTPQAPVSDFRLSFSGGAQAALTTPTTCGTYVTTADFTPWASPLVADALTTSVLTVNHGTNGAPCPASPLPFSPSMIAGSTTDQAGGFTNFSLLLQAPDDQQRIERLQFKTPEGLLGEIAKVPLCTESQANRDECPEASQIGHTVVASGPGPYPLVIPQPGQTPAPIYLTAAYDGAPYGLLIKVPLHIGPFDLQTQVVRATIEVDRLTSQLTVTTDPLPQVVDGVPTDLRTINAVIDRPGFMFNPTGCNSMPFNGTAYGSQGATAPISSHFQMGSCRSLLFKPHFSVSTSGHTSRQNGASLDAKILYPTGSLGANQATSQSNIEKVKVDLPRQLPSRLTTLQKACPVATFDANPAGCAPASIVGHATAVTPVLPVALTGPVYFVSHAGEAFPQLVVVLQGYGVTVDLVGDTFISKAGITSSTFNQVPDVPIASFELVLPQGKYSALAANGNLCKPKLIMPTEFVGHNGAVIHQATRITVTGCAKAKKARVRGKAGKQRKK